MSHVSNAWGLGAAARWLLLAVLAVCSAWGVWQSYQARRVGDALAGALQRVGPPPAGPDERLRQTLASAAGSLQAGRLDRAASTLNPPEEFTAVDRAAAQRFLARHEELRRRLIAAVAAAERCQADGQDVPAAQAALRDALAAAARGDAELVAGRIELAAAMLDPLAGRAGGAAWPGGVKGVAARAACLESSVSLGEELMTESYAAAQRVIRRSAWHCQAQQYAEAAALLDLAGELLGQPLSDGGRRELPAWFLPLAETPPAGARPEPVAAAVRLAEAVSQAESPSPVIRAVVLRARQELDGGRTAEAAWWASLALQTLALDPATAAAAAEGESAEESAP